MYEVDAMRNLIRILFLAFLCAMPLHAQKAKPKPIDGIGGYNLGSVYFTK